MGSIERRRAGVATAGPVQTLHQLAADCNDRTDDVPTMRRSIAHTLRVWSRCRRRSIVLLPSVDAQNHAVMRDLAADLIERDRARMPALVQRLIADLHQRSRAHTIEAWNGRTQGLAADTPFRLTLGVLHVDSIAALPTPPAVQRKPDDNARRALALHRARMTPIHAPLNGR
ncbi:MAG TPA: hypothetical protein VFO28_04580 [Burkholderiaceae bacterium]|nr:hypothetical protein [Burkholderiaceae bacterium]